MRSSVLSPRDRRPVPVGRLAVRKTAARTGRRVSCSLVVPVACERDADTYVYMDWIAIRVRGVGLD
jgi:hypothetical protein